MNVQERQERLSELGRGKVTDLVTVNGDGDVRIDLTGMPNPGALSEITSRTEVIDQDSGAYAVVTRVKMADPVKAIAELNRMDGIGKDGTTVNVDNRSVNITLKFEEERDSKL